MAKRLTRKQTAPKAGADKRVYTLDVFIINGPMTARFVKKNRVISRTIQIRGNQTLEVLHNTIFYAFEREDNHMYEFQIGGKGPMDPKARRYTLHVFKDDEDPPAGDVEWTPIGSLGLKVGDAFGYWFDFGDDWWHQINVVAIEDVSGRAKFPKIVKRVGESPPQYVDWDEEDEEE